MTPELNRGLLSLALLFAGPIAAPRQEPSPNLPAQAVPVRTVLVLPPGASVAKVGIKGGTPVVEQSNQLEAALRRAANSALQEKGCTVLPDPTSQQPSGSSDELKYSIDDLQKSFDSLLPKLHKKPKDVRHGRFSLGDDVSKVNPNGSTDALVFIRAEGFMSTGGEKTFDVMTGGIAGILIAQDRLSVQAAVVDARTGVVTAYGRHHHMGGFLKHEKPVDDSMKDVLKDFSCAPAGQASSHSESAKP